MCRFRKVCAGGGFRMRVKTKPEVLKNAKNACRRCTCGKEIALDIEKDLT
jgi:hypothetical protein